MYFRFIIGYETQELNCGYVIFDAKIRKVFEIKHGATLFNALCIKVASANL